MVNLSKIIIINFFIIITGCGFQGISNQDKIELNYDEGIKFYNNKKYSKAKESFKYVMLHSMGSRLALESEFYLSESLYNLKEYEDALYGYDNYARSSQNLELIELSRFRLCQCAYSLTTDYNKDQSATIDAIDKIEIFLEDYPQSEYYLDILSIKSELEYRLAKKEYESAILYMKLQEYKGALIYLFEILDNNTPAIIHEDVSAIALPSNKSFGEYDILLKDLLDNTRIMILYAYLFDEKDSMAEAFYALQIDKFYNSKSKDKAIELIEDKTSNRFASWWDIYLGISK